MGRIWTRPRTPVAAGLRPSGNRALLPRGSYEIHNARLASSLQIAIDGSLPFTRMMKGVNGIISLTSEGTPSSANVGGDAYRPATSVGPTTTALTFDTQWLTGLGRSVTLPFTYFVAFTPYSASPGDQQGVFHLGQSAGGGALLYNDGAIKASATHWSNDVYNFGSTEAGRRYVVCVAQWLNGSTANTDFWLDGVKRYTETAPSVSGGYNLDSNSEIGRVFNGQYGDSFNGTIEYFFLWSERLPDYDIRQLYNNLGYLVKPANDRSFLYPVAAPAASIAPQHFHHRHISRAG